MPAEHPLWRGKKKAVAHIFVCIPSDVMISFAEMKRTGKLIGLYLTKGVFNVQVKKKKSNCFQLQKTFSCSTLRLHNKSHHIDNEVVAKLLNKIFYVHLLCYRSQWTTKTFPVCYQKVTLNSQSTIHSISKVVVSSKQAVVCLVMFTAFV